MSGSNPKAATAGPAPGPGGLVAGKEEKKKAGGGVLNRLKARRQAPPHSADDGTGAAVTEQELLALDTIRPEHVLRLNRVTESEWRACRPRPPWAPGRSRGRPGRVAALGTALLSASLPDTAGKGFRVQPHLGLAPVLPGPQPLAGFLSALLTRPQLPQSPGPEPLPADSVFPRARAGLRLLTAPPPLGRAVVPSGWEPSGAPLCTGGLVLPSVKHVAVAFWQT